MVIQRFILGFQLISFAYGYAWGAPSCGAPQHDGGFSSSTDGISLSLDDSNRVVLAATSQFRGFLMSTDVLSFSKPSPNADLTDVCDGRYQNAAVDQTNSAKRNTAYATISCDSAPGTTFTVTAYVVFRFSSPYQRITKSFTCPTTVSSTSTTTKPGTGSSSSSGSSTSTALVPSETSGQFETFGGMLTVSWTPTLIYSRRRRLLEASGGFSDVQVLFNLSEYTSGWIGIGFGYNDGLMTGGKKAIVLTHDSSECSVEFHVMINNNLEQVSSQSSDPWNVSPSCTVLTPSLVSLSFTIGGSSSIQLPPVGTRMYTLVAGGLGVPLGAHGPTREVRRVDFLTAEIATVEQPINPFYYWHGILFIVNFAILMPLTAFLIMFDRARFYFIHKLLGVAIVVILASGWILVSPAESAQEEGSYASFSGTSVGSSHKNFGVYGCIVASIVCAVGVLLWVIRLPPTMRLVVRYLHGIGGIAISFFGPYVVWTGWAQLQILVPPVSALTDTPWLWLSLALAFLVVYLTKYFIHLTGKKPERLPVMTVEQVNGMVRDGKLVLIVNNKVCEISSSFSHPGGRAVLEQFNGQDVTDVMLGNRSFNKPGGRSAASYRHSSSAFALADGMAIGTLPGKGDGIELSAKNVVSASGVILSMDKVNTATDFPVRLFRIRLKQPLVGKEIRLGSMVFVSLPDNLSVQRRYTVCRTEGNCIVEFCIKIYSEGVLTPKLDGLKIGDSVFLTEPASHISIPCVPSRPSLAIFLAGGTGVTPMIGYFSECMQLALGGILMWWIRDEGDLFLLSELNEWGKLYNVNIQVFFTQPKRASTISAKSGRISTSAIVDVLGATSVNISDIAWIMSGPDGFIKAAQTTLDQLRVRSDRIISLD